MVVGGDNALNDVEFVDLSGQQRTCNKPADSPGGSTTHHGSTGAYFDGSPIICGAHSSTCYRYNNNVRIEAI